MRVADFTALVAIAALCASFGRSAPRAAQAPAPAFQRRALLVGVTKFTNPAVAVRGLNGPGNDVALFASVLRDRLDVPAGNIRTLAGLPDDGEQRPTRANIEREFRRLRDVSTSGDQVVILMAGHGSQQPANQDPADVEPDGLDEIFLPADAGPWDGSKGTVTNAIVDDDLRAWLTDIRNKGASVWIVLDSCFSGTMTRGAPDEVERERMVPMSALIPQWVIDAVRRRIGNRPAAAPKPIIGLSPSAGAMVAMYAADSTERTTEGIFGGPGSDIQGLFTYTLSEIIGQLSSPLTYRELAQRVLDRYRARQRFASTPTFEGGGLDRQVLDQRTWPDRPRMLIRARMPNGRWALDAGAVHGVSSGSMLEVFPPAGSANAERSLGAVRVASTAATTALVEPAGFGSTPAARAADLVDGSRARIVYWGVGDLRLKVALQREMATRGEATYAIVPAGAGPRPLETALGRLTKATNGLVERVASADADWFVRVQDNSVILVPAGGWHPDATPVIECNGDGHVRSQPPVRRFRVAAANDPKLNDLMADALRKIARATNLQRFATTAGTGPRLELSVVRFDRPAGGTGRPLLQGAKDVVVRAGEYVEYGIRNAGTSPADVTLLYVDAAFGITPVFPLADNRVDGRILPGVTRTVRVQVSGCPLGWESTVLIGVESQGPRQDFTMLAQDAVRGTERGPGAPASPLQQLLESASFGRGADVRGPPASRDLDKFAVSVASWRTESR